MPSLRSLSQLRALLPYAAKLLPVLTGVALGEPVQQRANLSALDHHFGEIQSESRGLRSRVEGQSEQIERLQERLDGVASTLEKVGREQQEFAKSLQSLRELLKGLFFAVFFLLAALAIMSVLILLHAPHA